MIVSSNSWATNNSQTALIMAARFEVDLKALHSTFLNSQLLLIFIPDLVYNINTDFNPMLPSLVFLIQKLFPLQYIDRFSYMSNTDKLTFSALACDLIQGLKF